MPDVEFCSKGSQEYKIPVARASKPDIVFKMPAARACRHDVVLKIPLVRAFTLPKESDFNLAKSQQWEFKCHLMLRLVFLKYTCVCKTNKQTSKQTNSQPTNQLTSQTMNWHTKNKQTSTQTDIVLVWTWLLPTYQRQPALGVLRCLADLVRHVSASIPLPPQWRHDCCCLLAALRPSNMQVYLKERSARITACAATLK